MCEQISGLLSTELGLFLCEFALVLYVDVLEFIFNFFFFLPDYFQIFLDIMIKKN